jgi:hypothetical protein
MLQELNLIGWERCIRTRRLSGTEASEAAGNTINGVRQQINHAAEPFYQASEGILLTPAEMTHVRAIPGWTEARDAVRNNEQLNWRVRASAR